MMCCDVHADSTTPHIHLEAMTMKLENSIKQKQWLHAVTIQQRAE